MRYNDPVREFDYQLANPTLTAIAAFMDERNAVIAECNAEREEARKNTSFIHLIHNAVEYLAAEEEFELKWKAIRDERVEAVIAKHGKRVIRNCGDEPVTDADRKAVCDSVTWNTHPFYFEHLARRKAAVAAALECAA